MYQNLDYNDKLLVLHLSDTMKDIELFRQNVIDDALSSVRKTENARLAWLSHKDMADSSSSSSVQHNVVNMKNRVKDLENIYKDALNQLTVKVMMLTSKRVLELSTKLISLSKTWALYHSNQSEHLELIETDFSYEASSELRELMDGK